MSKLRQYSNRSKFLLLIFTVFSLFCVCIVIFIRHFIFYCDTSYFNLAEEPIGSPVQIIHQSWINSSIPTQFLKFTHSWIDYCFENWTYYLWSNEDNLNLVMIYYPWFLKKYLSFPREINRADVARYMYMHHYGGIYTDLDNECLVPFESLLTNYSLVFGAMDGQFRGTKLREGLVQNSFFYSVPRHPFWLELLEIINQSKGNDIPEIETGPVRLSNFISTYHRNNNVDKSIKIYHPIYFNPFSWLEGSDWANHCKDKGQMSEVDWKICRSRMKAKGAYVVQYHVHMWF